MSFFEFPHTRTYDSDLGWLIKHFKSLSELVETLENWKDRHEPEYQELYDKVEGLIHNLVDVIVPWDSSVEYPIFSMVEYQGTNYIALQDVPIGVMITNTDYWRPANNVIEQINAIGQTVNDVYKNLRNVINVKERGADNTGNADISDLLLTLIESNPHGTFYFPEGYYRIDKEIDLPSSCEIMLDTNATIEAGAEIDYIFKLSTDGNREDYEDVFGLKHFKISGGIIDCRNLAQDCIVVESTYFTKIENVRIRDFNRYGVSIAPSGYNLAGCNIEHCVIWGNGTSACGVYDNGSDNNVYFTTVTNCQIGFRSRNDFYLGCSVWTDENGTYTDSIGYYSITAIHMIGCTADTVQRALYIANNSQATVEDFNVINNNAVATPTADTYVVYCEAANCRLYYSNIVIILTAPYTFSNYMILLSGKNINDSQHTAIAAPWSSHDITTSEATIIANYRYIDGEMILYVYKTSGAAVSIPAWGNIALGSLPTTTTLKYYGGLQNVIVLNDSNAATVVSLQISKDGAISLVNDSSAAITIGRMHLIERYITANY